jgi:hypothetical protein
MDLFDYNILDFCWKFEPVPDLNPLHEKKTTLREEMIRRVSNGKQRQ